MAESSKYTKVLAIDPGSLSLGYALFAGQKLGRHGVIQSKSKDPLPARLNRIFKTLQGICAVEHPTCIVAERYFVKGNRGAGVVHAVLGIIQLLSHQLRLPYEELVSSSVKKAITGSGRATKEQVKDAVLKAYPDDVECCMPADAYDAIALGISVAKRENDE